MKNSKNFNMFLMDGEVTGRIKCTLANWTGLAFKVPRTHLDRCKDREDLKQSGIYFLFSENDNGDKEVYIGQAGIRKNGKGILGRVLEHLNDETFFSEAILLTTQNNSFGPTEITFLENKFTNMAREIDRYIVRNGNEPNAGNVTEEKESELEDFVEYSKIVLGVLGYKLFVPLVSEPEVTKEEVSEEFRLHLSRKSKKSGRKIEAKCNRTSEGFVVLAGSMIEEIDSEAIPAAIKEIRDKCKENGEIIDGKLIKNQLFNSPSYAACFVLGMHTNGKTDWKTVDGQTLKSIEMEEFH